MKNFLVLFCFLISITCHSNNDIGSGGSSLLYKNFHFENLSHKPKGPVFYSSLKNVSASVDTSVKQKPKITLILSKIGYISQGPSGPVSKTSTEYKYFHLDDGPQILIGKNLEGVAPYMKDDTEAMILLNQGTKNFKVARGALVVTLIAAIPAIALAAVENYTLIVPFAAISVTSFIVYLIKANKTFKYLRKAIKTYNTHAGYGPVDGAEVED